ncbi:conserved hypothetical protein [Methanohalobium evestigatum Z-7303]|uniref:Uncharacterized protein n=1 Tax=Methanohalobium evestigatum (strain ATCC BAA-1072 / DSM 3721 / NBRC 107634 / OCM 161 / Z-7303) TaxID=644295 RepID=D7E6Q3_METEZ|nr:hypothetical protein [Methanohalobium evestigatum]ADI73275.1 conserved hypothetical protein [Methanohalobium evestigatum Z-7303]
MDNQSLKQQIEDACNNLNQFFNNIAVLLKDCDRLMAEEGYTPFNGNTASYEISRSILNPEGWYPSYFSRAYVPEESSGYEPVDKVLFISIFLRYGVAGCHDVFMDDGTPLIVGGYIRPDDFDGFTYAGWLTKSWFWKDESNNISNANGEVYGTYKSFKNVKEIKSFAYPLGNIKNTTDIKGKIIERLVQIDSDDF